MVPHKLIHALLCPAHVPYCDEHMHTRRARAGHALALHVCLCRLCRCNECVLCACVVRTTLAYTMYILIYGIDAQTDQENELARVPLRRVITHTRERAQEPARSCREHSYIRGTYIRAYKYTKLRSLFATLSCATRMGNVYVLAYMFFFVLHWHTFRSRAFHAAAGLCELVKC